MTIEEAVTLGIVQGITEFLPISSTAHLLVVRSLMHHPHPEDAFTTVIQLGTLAAVFAYFRADVIRLLRGIAADLHARRIGSTPDSQLAWLIVLGTLPVVFTGLFFKKWLKATFYNATAIAWVSIAFALVLALAEWWSRRRPPRSESSIGWRDSLWIGVWQALAFMPGGSRSGTTITGGLFAGLARPVAARFSFLLSLPAVLAAGVKELYDEFKKLYHPKADESLSLFASGDDVQSLVIGTLVSAVVGYLAIAGLLHFLKRYSTFVFVAYRVAFGILLLVMVARGVIR